MMLAGGSGYLGNLIINYFKDKFEIYVLTRSPNAEKNQDFQEIKWDGKSFGDWVNELENADILINLAGKNINTRFTEDNKKAILNSRIQSTEILGKAIENCQNPPKMWLNASSVAVYKESKSEVRTEDSPTIGQDFLSEVSQQWEKAFYAYPNEKTRKAVFRISLIMGDSKGSAYQNLKQLVNLGAGGKAGSGEQMVSWISEIDFLRALEFILDKKLEGAFNFCNTQPLSNKQMMQELREKYNILFGLPAPEFAIKLGAGIIGTAPELVLRSQNVFPKRLVEHGFEFKLENLKKI